MSEKTAEMLLSAPFDSELLLRKRKMLKRQLLAREGVEYLQKRVAILGGSTTADVRDMLELFLLARGIKPTFYESEYGKYYEDAVFGTPELDAFQPELIVIWTSFVNIQSLPSPQDTATEVAAKLDAEYGRFERMWTVLAERYGAAIVQNNMELPSARPLGSLDAVLPQGMGSYVAALNTRFATYAQTHSAFYLHDLHGVAMQLGLQTFHDAMQYHAFKFAVRYEAVPQVAAHLAQFICALWGKAKKCLVLDLDNTLWGGVIGDDGVEHIQLGHETAVAEAYMAFQQYVLALKERGVLLAVCSKNDEAVAQSGFTHPDSVLHVEDFAAFHANWEPKDVNIRAIAQELNLGLDSFVFIDDNPAERAIVRQSLPEVAVPEVDAADVPSYIRAIEANGYFETVALSQDDFRRNETYQANRARAELATNAASYDEYLASLQMRAEIAPFQPVYFDRIAQLTNKSNQFNLTTRRYTRADIEHMAAASDYVTLYGRLEDRFGDNGLVSVVIGHKEGSRLRIDLWLMSCRVLKRGLEQAMLDVLVARAHAVGCTELVGEYLPTKKNHMVANLYGEFGFTQVNAEADGQTVWRLPLAGYECQARFIEVNKA